MDCAEFNIYYSYAQLAVMDPGEMLNMWTERHYKQGFSWRAGSVSFRTLSEDNSARVRIRLTKTMDLPAGAVRAILVPYEVRAEGVEVVTVTEGVSVDITPGKYGLLFAVLALQDGEEYHIQFIENAYPEPSILISDPSIEPTMPLCMEAEPAT